MEPSLWRRLKTEAAQRGKTMQECLNEFLRLGLESASRAVTKRGGWRLPTLALGRPLVDAADRHVLDDLARRP